MADPVLNEKAILAELDHIASVKSASTLKNGAKLTIMDGFDRRPLREPFGELVGEACSLQANLSRLEFASHLKSLHEQGKVNAEMLDTAVKDLTKLCEDRRAAVLKLFKPVTEMRLEADAVH